jgi:hypothetical protein
MDRQKMCEGGDAFRADRSPTREQLGAGETEMSKRFIAAKKLVTSTSAALSP